MRIALVAVTLSGTAFMLHWLLWRVRIPNRQTVALLTIFTGTLIFGLAVAVTRYSAAWGLRGVWEAMHVAAFHIAMMLAYVVAYSALEERSPSMTILCRVADARIGGAAREEIEAALVAMTPVEVRLQSLVRDGLLAQRGDEYELTLKGRWWATLFSWWRTFLGFGKGG